MASNFDHASSPTSVTSPIMYDSTMHGLNLSKQVIINGMICVGDSWNTIDFDGIVPLCDNFCIVERSSKNTKYRGLDAVMGKQHLYEMKVADIGGGYELCLFVTADTIRPVNCVDPVTHSAMAYAFDKVIQDAIIASDAASDFVLNANPQYCVHKDHWVQVGEFISAKLNSNDEDIRAVFPEGASFHFVLQNWELGSGDCETLEKVKHIWRLEKVKKMTVHVAVDYTSPGNLLFFNSSFGDILGAEPSYYYNPFILPNSGNYTYLRLPTNAYHVVAMEQFNQFLNEVTENANGYFTRSLIVESLSKAYSKYLNGYLWRNTPNIANILDGSLGGLINKNILNNQILSGDQTPVSARCALIWSDIVSNMDADTIMERAIKNCTEFLHSTKCADPTLFTIFQKKQVAEYLHHLITVLFTPINNGIVTFNSTVNTNNNKFTKTYIFKHEHFADMFVAEAMLTRIFMGHLSDFPAFLNDFVILDKNDDGSINTWPFDKKYIREAPAGTFHTTIPITRCILGQVIPGSDSRQNQHVFYPDVIKPLGSDCLGLDARLQEIIFIGDNWNIVKPAGSIHIDPNLFQSIEKTIQHYHYYSKFPHMALKQYRFEIMYALVSNGTLPLLVTADTNKRVANTAVDKSLEVNQTKMHMALFRVIRSVIREKNNTKTHREWKKLHDESKRARTAKTNQDFKLWTQTIPLLSIYEEDWESIGVEVVTALYSDKFRAIFPEGARFIFLFAKNGVDEHYFLPRVQPSPNYDTYGNLRMENVKGKILVTAAMT